jgi:hypothetical protein
LSSRASVVVGALGSGGRGRRRYSSCAITPLNRAAAVAVSWTTVAATTTGSMPPVDGVRELLLDQIDAARVDGLKRYANKLSATVENRFTFPDDEILAATSSLRLLETDEEREEWNSIFVPISQE